LELRNWPKIRFLANFAGGAKTKNQKPKKRKKKKEKRKVPHPRFSFLYTALLRKAVFVSLWVGEQDSNSHHLSGSRFAYMLGARSDKNLSPALLRLRKSFIRRVFSNQ